MIDNDTLLNENVKKTTIIDIFKFICCFLVVCIHTKPFKNSFWLDAGVGLMTRIAVPYFFITSAYFLMLKDGKKYLKHTLNLVVLYSFWYILSLFCSKSTYLNANSFEFWKRVIINYFWLVNGNPLWFICALIWADLAMYLLRKKISPKVLLIIGAILLFIGYFFSTAYAVTSKIPAVVTINNAFISKIGTQNALFFAFPYVCLANYAVNDKSTLSAKKYFTLWMIFFVVLSVEAVIMVKFLHSTINHLWLSSLPMALFAFKFSNSILIRDRAIYYTMRKLSVGVYLIHPLIIDSIHSLLNSLHISDGANITLTITVFLISLLSSFLLYTLSKVKHLSFIKRIL